jgi:hypothetical protein
MAVFRMRWVKLGGHYHCRLFTAPQIGYTFAKCGDLVFHENEWEDSKKAMPGVEFMEESVETRDEVS